MPSTYTVGQRVRVIKKINLSPCAVVHAGEHGTVTYVDRNRCDIELDTLHPGLGLWRNTIWVFAGHDDIKPHLRAA